jgi:hypothetical protein
LKLIAPKSVTIIADAFFMENGKEFLTLRDTIVAVMEKDLNEYFNTR